MEYKELKATQGSLAYLEGQAARAYLASQVKKAATV